MDLLCKITDAEIGEKYIENENPNIRLSSRGIVLNKDNKIAIFCIGDNKKCKLPGGKIEAGETPEEAFKREVLEETGCMVEIIDNPGTIEEYKSKLNFKQISNVFIGKVIKDTKELHLTPAEQE